MPVKIKSSGGGSVSFDVPNTGTDYTLTMPARTGNIITSADANTISSGMLAANCITTSQLALSAVTFEKLSAPTKVVKFTQITYNTRVAWGTATDAVIWSPSYTKERSDTSLFIQMNLATFGTYSYCYNWFARYAGGTYVQGTMANIASGTGYNMRQSNEYLITGNTSTGSNTLDIKWTTYNNEAGNRPANVWNPNNSDEARLAQQFSTLNIWEII